MTDNSPEYFEQLANSVVNMGDGRREDVIAALRAAAVLARENAELREMNASLRRDNGDMCEKVFKLAAADLRAESAESANRALQAEVDRLMSILTIDPTTAMLDAGYWPYVKGKGVKEVWQAMTRAARENESERNI